MIFCTLVQVGNMQLDHDFWGRPEDMEAAGVVRPAYLVNATHPGADMAGMTAAGLASASLVRHLRTASGFRLPDNPEFRLAWACELRPAVHSFRLQAPDNPGPDLCGLVSGQLCTASGS